MTGKYSSAVKYRLAQAKWAGVRGVLRAMSAWTPIEKVGEGYTMVIGCPAPLISILGANLASVAKQDLSSCRAIVCVVDRPREVLTEDVEPRMRAEYPGLPLEFVYYTPFQAKVLDRLGYPAGFCWFSWQLGLGRVKTKYALLHDFDAFVLERTLLERRYQKAVSEGISWLGQRWYQGNGVERTDLLTTTFEMVLDAEMVRRRFKPIDLFNCITMHKGRTVEFDITLWCQSVGGGEVKVEAVDMPEEEFVHPSQVVHQFTELTHIRGYVPPPRNRLPFVLYLLEVAGNRRVLEQARRELMAENTFTLGGRRVDLSRTEPSHISWLFKQAGLMEEALFGGMRGEVAEYWDEVMKAVRRVSSAEREVGATASPSLATSCTVHGVKQAI